MPIKAPPPAAPAPVPTYNWSGFYIGGNAGGAWGNFDPISAMPLLPGGVIAPDVSIFNALGASQGIKPNGFTGGAEAGYNFQWHNIVFGLEGDCESLRLSGNSTVAGFFAPAAPVNLSASAHASWLATARGRIGITADNWLFYGTGGVALTALRGGFTFTDPTAGDTEPPASLSTTRVGYVAGGGLEVGSWSRWSVKVEYLFVDFGRVSTVGPFDAVQPIDNSIELKASIVRGGVNYRF